MLIIIKHFNFCCFRALAYTTLDRLCAVFLYNSSNVDDDDDDDDDDDVAVKSPQTVGATQRSTSSPTSGPHIFTYTPFEQLQ